MTGCYNSLPLFLASISGSSIAAFALLPVSHLFGEHGYGESLLILASALLCIFPCSIVGVSPSLLYSLEVRCEKLGFGYPHLHEERHLAQAH